MSIKTATYQLCKKLKSIPERKQIQDVINNLNFSRDDITSREDRSTFGYYARHSRIQLLGYLLIHEAQGVVDAGPVKFFAGTLTEDEYPLFYAFHLWITRLNAQCAGTLRTRMPVLGGLLDPYFGLKPLRRSATPTAYEIADDLFGEVLAEFNSHAGWKPVLDTSLAQSNPDFPKVIRTGMQEYERLIISNGVFHSPEELHSMMVTSSRNSPQFRMARLILSLVSLRASLRVINQMCFQALRSDQLMVFDEDNIIEVSQRAINSVTTGTGLVYQPDISTWMLELRDIVLLKAVGGTLDTDELSEVASTSIHHSVHFGETGRLEFRKLDEDLNPYGAMMHRLV